MKDEGWRPSREKDAILRFLQCPCPSVFVRVSVSAHSAYDTDLPISSNSCERRMEQNFGPHMEQ